MRQTVVQFGLMQQCLPVNQDINDLLVDFENMVPCKHTGMFCKYTVIIDEVQSLQAIFFAHLEILDTMIRCGVHRTRTGIDRDVLAKDDRHGLVIKRVLHVHVLELQSAALANHCMVLDVITLQTGIQQGLGPAATAPCLVRLQTPQRCTPAGD